MRIIAGSARGRTLIAPKGSDTRPTSERAREALFNILGRSVDGAEVLDLFAGTGALALEAMSRGAVSSVLCDSGRAAQQAIRRNAEAVLGADWQTVCTLLARDYKSAIDSLRGRAFDLVFLDPPYRMREYYPDALNRLHTARAFKADAVIVLEHPAGSVPEIPDTFQEFDARAYGETSFTFLRLREGSV